MIEFDARVLIDNLPAFNGSAESNSEIQQYRRYYGIDFQDLDCNQQLGSLSAAGFNIAVQRFTPAESRGQALLVHGYHDHHALYGHLIHFLLQQQLTVTSFDLPGHGLSSGERGTIEDFNQYQQVLAEILTALPDIPGPLHWIGQSTGAAILNQYLLSQQPEVSGQIVMLAPLICPARWPWVKLAHSVLKPWATAIPRQFTENSHDTDFLEFLKNRDPLQGRTITVEWVSALRRWIPQFLELPASQDYAPLMIQGKQDDTVDWRFNLPTLEKKFPKAKTLLLPDGRHHLANESTTIRQHYLDWLKPQL
ncbi:MAG: alpha/beta hydrolase [Motiliproteus sp.]|nr:alpha/beta hydrolase [Motiliproteus sp.]MCW9050851.1 alpha/beta hydrolase [Motiliproteus sp.]